MTAHLHWTYAVVHLLLSFWNHDFFHRHGGKHPLLMGLMLNIDALFYDNFVLGIGRYIGPGTLLSVLSFFRFVFHAFLTPSLLWTGLYIVSLASPRQPNHLAPPTLKTSNTTHHMVHATVFCLVLVGIYEILLDYEAHPICEHNGGLVRYKFGALSLLPPELFCDGHVYPVINESVTVAAPISGASAAIVTVLVLIGMGVHVAYVQQGNTWLLIGSLLMLIISGLAATIGQPHHTLWMGNGGEVLLVVCMSLAMRHSIQRPKQVNRNLHGASTTMRFNFRNFWTALIFMVNSPLPVASWKNCSIASTTGKSLVCPSRATCCPSGCITGSPHAPDSITGACCDDDDDKAVTVPTGCGDGYVCGYNDNMPSCRLVTPVNEESPDVLPRYELCNVKDTRLFGWHMTPNNSNNNPPPLAYFSSGGGPLDASDAKTLNFYAHITTVVVVIHGSARNADDYLCCTQQSVPIAHRNATLVVAPWFRAPQDAALHAFTSNIDDAATTSDYLEWAEQGPIPHTWRYGANALNTNISSYAVLDDMVLHLQADTVRFPRLRRIVVAGHSAGGQYTQRWALLTPVLQPVQHRASVRIVVANPRSYAYLDARRFLANGTFGVPDAADIAACPDYDEWEWGLSSQSSNATLQVPYKETAIAMAGGVAAVVDRYRTRSVVYLSGGLDTLPQDDTCRAQLQGQHRRERSARFVSSLAEVYGRPVHRRLVGHGIPHDHCLLFQSPEGRQALFGE